MLVKVKKPEICWDQYKGKALATEKAKKGF